MSKKGDTISRTFKKCGITLALNWSEIADLNIEGLEYYKIPSAEEAYELQLHSESSICEEEQEDIWFHLSNVTKLGKVVIPNKEACSFLIFHIPAAAPWIA